ncbi:hypothetical protein ACFQ4U_09155 [Micrococcus antarcticus]
MTEKNTFESPTAQNMNDAVGASPYSTGGGGVSLEHHHAAWVMSHIITETSLKELGAEYIPRIIRFQAAHLSRIDDLFVEGVDSSENERSTVYALRRDPKIIPSHEPTVKLFKNFIDDFLAHENRINSGEWRQVLATSPISKHGAEISKLTVIAKSVGSNEDFRKLLLRPNFTTTQVKERLKQLDSIVRSIRNGNDGSTLTWKFLKSLETVRLEFEGSDTQNISDTTSLLRKEFSSQIQNAEDIYYKLVSFAGSYASNAAVKNKNEILRDLNLRNSTRTHSESIHVESTERSVKFRRRTRRSALGLSAKQVDASLIHSDTTSPNFPKLSNERVKVLVGPVGSGKTDLAERWLLSKCMEYQSKTTDQLPIWLRADEILGPLRHAIKTELATIRQDQSINNLFIVIDGLDEMPGDSSRLFFEALALCESSNKVEIVLTSRKEVDGFSHLTYFIPEMSQAQSDSLLAALVKSKVHTRAWPASLRVAARRPLFALLVAVNLEIDEHASPIKLIARSVETAISSESDRQMLHDLAINLTRAGRPLKLTAAFGNIQTIHTQKSRLLTVENGRWRFSLPIFEQFFAAETVLLGKVDQDEIFSSIESFYKWRYALALSVELGEPEQVDPLLSNVGRWNLGALGWIVSNGFNTRSADPGHATSNWEVQGKRFWNAMEVVLNSLGNGAMLSPLAPNFVTHNPASLDDVVLEYGADTKTGTRYLWRGRDGNERQIQRLSNQTQTTEVPSLIQFKWTGRLSIEDRIWPEVINEAAKWLDKLMASRNRVTDMMPEGIVKREARASAVSKLSRILSPNPKNETVIDYLSRLLASPSGLSSTDLTLPDGTTVSRHLLKEIWSDLSTGRSQFDRYEVWPLPDIPSSNFSSKSSWEFYSEKRIIERTNAVFDGAIKAYTEIVKNFFPRFGLTLGHAAILPARAVGHVTPPFEHQTEPTLSYSLKMTDEDSQGSDSRSSFIWSTESLDYFEFNTKFFDQDSLAKISDRPFSSHYMSISWLNIFGKTPATDIALSWIAQDLQKIGWKVKNQRF